MNYFPYDIETYPNCWMIGIVDAETGGGWVFEYSERMNELPQFIALMEEFANKKHKMVGYNNVGYDYPVIHYILENHGYRNLTNDDIYRKSKAIIESKDIFEHTIWDRDMLIPQVDLYKIHHFDNANRRTSLKSIEIAMQMSNVRDLPYDPTKPLAFDEMENLKRYMIHDINATLMFFKHSLPQIEFREQLNLDNKGMNFTNYNDTKVGKQFFIKKLEEAKVECFTRVGGKRVPNQSPRSSVALGDVVVPEVQFYRPEFKALLDWIMRKRVHGTKEVLNNLEYDYELFTAINPDVVKVTGIDLPEHKIKPHQKISGTKLIELGLYDSIIHDTSYDKYAENLSIRADGFNFDLGTGGIHGSVEATSVFSDEEGVIYDWDVASYYPNLSIKNNLKPEHFPEKFCEIFEWLYQERKKAPKGTPENAMLKLALNGVYGDSNNVHSPFYDPKFMMSITINGQLLLLMLTEQLMTIEGLKVIQINTDGVTVKCPHQHVELMKAMCKWWEDLTRLELESVVYSKMFINNVNTYIGVYEDGKVKRKKSYCYEWRPEAGKARDLDWHQNMSMMVVAKAAEAHLVHGKSVEEFIYSHTDPFDFMIRAKVPRSNTLKLGDTEIQRTSRVYVAHVGHDLIKYIPPTKGYTEGQWKRKPSLTNDFYANVIQELKLKPSHEDQEVDAIGLPWDERINTSNRSVYKTTPTGICAGHKMAECNHADDFNWANVKHQYYIDEVYKLIRPVKGFKL